MFDPSPISVNLSAATTLESSTISKTAYRIKELAKDGPFGRSKLYVLIRQGKLRAKKLGRATIVLDEDWRECLKNLPELKLKDPKHND